jgi:hypothetical protein
MYRSTVRLIYERNKKFQSILVAGLPNPQKFQTKFFIKTCEKEHPSKRVLLKQLIASLMN